MLARVPVSGADLAFAPLTGCQEMLVADAAALDVPLGLRLAATVAGDSLTVDGLSVHDVDALLLEFRRHTVGDRILAVVHCPSCAKPNDVAFGVADYLKHHRPAAAAGVSALDDDWWRLDGTSFEFRLPRESDRATIQGARDPLAALVERCIRPAPVPAAVRRRIERAMARLAPLLARPSDASCVECGTVFTMHFDPSYFVLREIRDGARDLVDDVHRIAAAYHWSEEAILRLPRTRRRRYAEAVRDAGAA